MKACVAVALAALTMAGGGAAQIVANDPAVHEYTLRNPNGMTVRFLNFGGIITSVDVPDRRGRFADVVLGYGSARDYRERETKNEFGALIGRYAGRIAGARFAIDGREYRLTPNDGPNALHGGAGPNFSELFWRVRLFRARGVSGATLRLVSPDGAQGFPGRLTVTVTYRLFADNRFRIDYEARTNKPTVINLTNHSYFNLAGQDSGSVASQRLRIKAARWVEAGQDGIPTGRLAPVAGTPLDFRAAHAIGEGIDARAPMMAARGGYNHAWAVDGGGHPTPVAAVWLADPHSGRTLTIVTTEPSVQVYTDDYIDGQDVGPTGKTIRPRDGVALETEHFSDSPNRPRFPSTLLHPGQVFRSTTVWRFGVSR